jgi:phosphoribosylanthranilate isomerase
MKIKICGITNQEDALICETLRVDYLGFIFYSKSKRFINYQKAKEIIQKLDINTNKVGVFVDTKTEEINKIAKEIGLTHVQLHGDENSNQVKKIEFPVIKALSGNNKNIENEIKNFTNADLILLDSMTSNERGGTGKTFNWLNLKNIKNKSRIILSGGLNEANIMKAINETNIEFFDICSGVEESPGIKNIKKLETIVELIRNEKK